MTTYTDILQYENSLNDNSSIQAKYKDNLQAVLPEEEFDDIVGYIRKLLWNEIEEIDPEISHEILITGISLYYNDILDIVDIRVLLNLYYSAGVLESLNFIAYVYLILKKEEQIGDDPVAFFKFHMKDYGVDNFDLRDVVTVAETLGEVKELYRLVASKVASLVNRPEYTDQVLENTGTDELVELQYWVDPEIRLKIVSQLLNDTTENFTPGSYDETLEFFNSDDFLSEFPVNHKTLGDQIASLEPRSIDMDELSDIPQKLSREWLPSFVYSKPELEENIRIFYPGGPHIGHSAIVVKSNFGSFMMDCGLSVVNTSKSRWQPLMEKLDFMLVSHAHMDHSGSLPIIYGSERKLPWFGLRETKVMTEMLWSDTRKILGYTVDNSVIENNSFMRRLMSKGSIINAINNFNEIELNRKYHLMPSIDIQAYHAAHLFGSVGFEISIGGKRILYTGDFNADKGAEFPMDCDFNIFDSTYFERYQDYPKPEEGLKAALDDANRILIPSFSMGRSQEMLFKLKELGAEKDWTIYLTGMGGRLASKLNLNVGSSGGRAGGGIQIVPTVDPEDFTENSIVIGGQGMLQAGTSRRLLDYTKDDEETSVILCGYQAPNTLGYHLLRGDDHLLKTYKQRTQRVKISGHTTGERLDQFMDDLSNRKVMVHSPIGAYENRQRDDVERPHGDKSMRVL